MTFQTLDRKERSFLNLVDDNYEDIELSYIKGGSWLQAFGYLNLLCTWATRAITNYAPIGEYHLRFFPNKDFSCPCSNFPIESKRHVLYNCKRHNGYWNSRRDSLCHFILFLIANPKAFIFIDYSQLVASNWFWNNWILFFLSYLFSFFSFDFSMISFLRSSFLISLFLFFSSCSLLLLYVVTT